MFGRKSIYEKCFEDLENELVINLENNYKDLAWDAVKNLRKYVDSLKNFQASGEKSIEAFISGTVKKPPKASEIDKMETKLRNYEKGMEGYHH